MKYCIYEDQYCYYVWKPADTPSTFGTSYSFLEELRDEKTDIRVVQMMNQLKQNFTQQEEYGLLNRLDTPTTGLLYFAKTQEIKNEYKALQKEGKVLKYYILEVRGDLTYWTKKNGNTIHLPIAHHKFENDRMVVLTSDQENNKIKGTLHEVKTKIEEFRFYADRNTSVVLVSIQKGIRHQIRSHFSAIGYPILGDPIYGKKKEKYQGNLQLFSVGLEVNK